ncbi:hypothetical protein [uncultured Arenimonas sp.]|uniref:hypothetical protein n=1 Tax=uncultured Arenimonas sp. TaxID=546226 RepID=UPI0030DCBC0E
MNSVPLAPALGQGVSRRRRQVNAWPKVVKALEDAGGQPQTHGQLKATTGLDHTNLSVALANHKALLVRTGTEKHYQYRLRTAEDPAYEPGA